VTWRASGALLATLAASACSSATPGDASAAATATAATTATSAASAAPSATTEAGEPAEHVGMARVPAGPFTMGADVGGEGDEHPAHRVTIAAYWLDLTEVTNAAYERCVADGACAAHDATSATKNHFGIDATFRGPSQPISAVSWLDARGYCAWAHKRLPTEAEWEKAARGEPARRFPWGDEPPTLERAVFGGGRTADVGTHPRGDGPYGHHDLAGNVWEWVEDVYDPLAYTREAASQGKGGTCEEALSAFDELRKTGKKGFTGSNPIPTECERVLRGGAFNYSAPGLRASNRVHHPERTRLVMAGFRCAAD
jgi:formylglycine-generating enzyme required for sulfatase activity